MGLLGLNKRVIPNLEKCVEKSSSITAEITTIIDLIDKEDFSSIFKAVMDCVPLFQSFEEEMKLCTFISAADETRIENWAKIFMNPMELYNTVNENLGKHQTAVEGDAAAFAFDIKIGRYEPAGATMAGILLMLVGPLPATSTSAENLYLY